MTVKNRRIFTSILFLLLSMVCSAQGDPVMPPPGPPSPPPGFPIDGGIITGVLFGLFYGVKKLLKKH